MTFVNWFNSSVIPFKYSVFGFFPAYSVYFSGILNFFKIFKIFNFLLKACGKAFHFEGEYVIVDNFKGQSEPVQLLANILSIFLLYCNH